MAYTRIYSILYCKALPFAPISINIGLHKKKKYKSNENRYTQNHFDTYTECSICQFMLFFAPKRVANCTDEPTAISSARAKEIAIKWHYEVDRSQRI